MSADRVVVIGAGMGGLAAAVDLARQGIDVEVLDRSATPGGKMRELRVGDALIDAGPTVFTMRWVFDSLFADAGASLDAALDLHATSVLARHAWTAGGQLDLFADIERSIDAIGVFSGPRDARGYRDFCKRSREIYETLRGPYIAASRPSPLQLIQRVGVTHLGALWRTEPMRSLWASLAGYFHDPRLRQLFGRYATYVGSSPLAAPATLMLIAHVEQEGVWMVQGGMRRVADALQHLGERHGARYRFNAHVEEIIVESGAVAGVRLVGGERIDCKSVVFNGDASALDAGMLGRAVSPAAVAVKASQRSLSAVTWCVKTQTSGFNLHHHNVFFADDYPAEFDAVFRRRSIVDAPTVYVCAQDRAYESAMGARELPAKERLLLLINAPADGDQHAWSSDQIAALANNTTTVLRRCGLELDADALTPSHGAVVTTPSDFNALFPATGGALYGRANHGPMASFARPGSRTVIPGLYLAGGSAHPGPGVPMATLSGRLAAQVVIDDFARTSLP